MCAPLSKIHKNVSGNVSLPLLTSPHIYSVVSYFSSGHLESWGKWKMLSAYTTTITAATVEEF